MKKKKNGEEEKPSSILFRLRRVIHTFAPVVGWKRRKVKGLN